MIKPFKNIEKSFSTKKKFFLLHDGLLFWENSVFYTCSHVHRLHIHNALWFFHANTLAEPTSLQSICIWPSCNSTDLSSSPVQKSTCVGKSRHLNDNNSSNNFKSMDKTSANQQYHLEAWQQVGLTGNGDVTMPALFYASVNQPVNKTTLSLRVFVTYRPPGVDIAAVMYLASLIECIHTKCWIV